MKKSAPDKIISQTAAAEIAGVKRQAINQLFKKDVSPYNFFTPDGKVDTSHNDWKIYLDDRSNKTQNNVKPVRQSAEKNTQRKDKQQTEDKPGKKNPDDDRTKWNREHALTGGYDPSIFYPQNPAQLKSLTDIVAKNLEMRIKLGDLIQREILDYYMDTITQCMQLLVDFGRGVSSAVCHKLDRMGMEKDVEKIINPEIKKIIEQIIRTCNDAKNRK